MPLIDLPPLPVPLADLPRHLADYQADHPDLPVAGLFAPYRRFEDRLRSAYAQEPDHPALADPLVNVVSVLGDGKTAGPAPPLLRTRARNPAAETEAERAGYIMALPDSQRRATGAPATVGSLEEFQANFGVFSEGALAELDWGNVVAAGSSVLNCLLPVPAAVAATAAEAGGRPSRRALRTYYHETFCPASDVDLFLYGLTPAQAEAKIRQIEAQVRDAVLAETTTVRTRHAVTICSEYPTRHIQIVLRLYGSVSEILAGFDVDCAAAAYDGRRVLCAPRALQALATQCNHVDLARRSPSYETRLAKYSHRGFEVWWPPLARDRIDPTLFDRSFARTRGLARLLVLERLPTPDARAQYAQQRRKERGRPLLESAGHGGGSNLKATHDDEVAEWVNEVDVSGYETFVLPYGRKYPAKKIEKLCYTQDLLLNAEWNQKKDREVYLHRHPAFFGRVDDILGDCCGCCPTPTTDREKEIAADESKIYVSGKISFLTDDPGRQQIGSFHPLTDDDWTDMAYIGNTARFFQAIVDGDVAYVRDWLDQGGDPNRRDHTGRTPLHLAVTCSTAAVVDCLVEHGARLVARLADGRTALHLAAQRGDITIVKILLDKSNANEAEEDEKADRRRAAKREAAKEDNVIVGDKEDEDEEDEGEMVDDEDDDDSDDDDVDDDDDDDDDSSFEARTASSGSVVEVTKRKKTVMEDFDAADDDSEPDVYDINAPSWDRPCTPLHYAITHGHEAVVRQLCEDYGADVLRPVKILKPGESTWGSGMMTLELVQPLVPARTAGASMARTLLALGATAAQADTNGLTVLQRCVEAGRVAVVEAIAQSDPAGTATALKHVGFRSEYSPGTTPLVEAAKMGHVRMVEQLLAAGAPATVTLDAWLKAAKASPKMHRLQAQLAVARAGQADTSVRDRQRERFLTGMDQPLIMALASPNPRSALALLAHGADPHARPKERYENNGHGLSWVSEHEVGSAENALALVRRLLTALRAYTGVETAPQTRYHFDAVAAAAYRRPVRRTDGADAVVAALPAGSWQRWAAAQHRRHLDAQYDKALDTYQRTMDSIGIEHVGDKKAAIADMIATLEAIEATILAAPPQDASSTGDTKETDTAKGAAAAADDKTEAKAAADTPTTTFAFTPEFENMPDASTDVRRAAYTRLYEAAWTGDLATIEQLTMAPWVPEAGADGGDDGAADPEPEPPLNLGVRDRHHGRPVSLAFMRGHYVLAAALLAIAHVQHTAGTDGDDKTPRVRYRLRAEGEPADDRSDCEMTDADSEAETAEATDSDEDMDAAADDDKNGGRSIRRLYRSLADNTALTVDILGAGSMKTKCAMTPLELLTAPCAPLVGPGDGPGDGPAAAAAAADPLAPTSLFRFVAEQDDSRALRILLDQAARFAALHDPVADPSDAARTDGGGGGPRFFCVPSDDVRALLRHGRIDMLATVLQRTGAGLPLDVLVERDGVAAAAADSSADKDKDVAAAAPAASTTVPVRGRRQPYQGLTVYGKKRGDWAEAGRRMHVGSSGAGGSGGDAVVNRVSPLLLAAASGSRAAVEWFLAGDGPRRSYLAFLEARAAAGDTRAQRLRTAPGGWDGAVRRWLDRDRDLVLLTAVAGDRYDANQVALVAFLAGAVPRAVGGRDSEGRTPLLLAAELGRLEMVRVLLAAGRPGAGEEDDADADADADAEPKDPAAVRQKGTGENLLHAALRHRPRAPQLAALLALLAPATRMRLFRQRSHHASASRGRTPLHHWLASVVPAYDADEGDTCEARKNDGVRTYDDEDADKALAAVLAALEVLLRHSGGCELGLLDGAGDTLLHTLAAKAANPRVLRAVLGLNAAAGSTVWTNGALLRRENAVGATPLDVARDRLLAALLPDPRDWSFMYMRRPTPRDWPTEEPKEFRPLPPAVFELLRAAGGDEDDIDERAKPLGQRVYRHRTRVERMVDICHWLGALQQQHPGPRRLASLLEANDVAARIATTYAKQRYPVVGGAKGAGADADAAAADKAKDAPKKQHPWIPPEAVANAWKEMTV